MNKLKRMLTSRVFPVICPALAIALAVYLLASIPTGCAYIKDTINQIDPSGVLVIEAADSLGYGVGLAASKNPKIRAKIEEYYPQIEAGGLTPTAVNGLLDALKLGGDEYKHLARKALRLLDLVGAKTLGESVIELGKVDPAVLQAAKQGYLDAISLSSKSYIQDLKT